MIETESQPVDLSLPNLLSPNEPQTTTQAPVDGVLAPRRHALKWQRCDWPDVRAAAVRNIDGLLLCVVGDARAARPPYQYVLLREGWRPGLTVICRQGW